MSEYVNDGMDWCGVWDGEIKGGKGGWERGGCGRCWENGKTRVKNAKPKVNA